MKILTFVSACCILAGAVSAQTKRGVFLLDRSGSMSAGNRVAKSLLAVDDDLREFFSAPGATEALIVEFATGMPNAPNAYRVLGGGWLTAAATARPAAQGSNQLFGSTPLAQSICNSIADLRARVLAGGSQLFCQNFLYVYSDGGENNSTGACGGGDDVNASNGRCLLDTLNTLGTVPYAGTSSNTPSWQTNTCSMISSLSSFAATECLFPSALVHGRLFNSVTDNPTESQVFRLIRSIVAQTGGNVVQIGDNDPYVPGTTSAITIYPFGCRANGELPTVVASDIARVGTSISVQLRGTTLQLPLLYVGFALRQPPLSLGMLGAPQCQFAVDNVVSHLGNFLPLTIPANPAFIGLELFVQGVATSPSISPIATSNVVGLRVMP